MRITFVIPSLVLTGGIRVVYEHSKRLIARGHRVALLAPALRPPALFGGSLPAWKRFLYEGWLGGTRDALDAYGLRGAVAWFDPANPRGVPHADVVIATAWETAEWVAAMPASAGVKYYLVQGYEAWTEDITERVDRTWKLPLRKMVVAGWLERLARERFGETVWARIPSGVDCERFRPPPARPDSARSVGMIYEPAPWKGAKDGMAAMWSMHRADPTIRFVLCGRYRLRESPPPGTRYVNNPRQAYLPEVYRSCDIFLSPSLTEGFSLVTLEAMACGCALIATSVGEVPEMGRPGEEYIMVPPGDSESLAREALALLREPARRRAIAAAGLALARRYSWERATGLLERALEGAGV